MVIAVFTSTYQRFQNFNMTPKKSFIRIGHPNDVHGRMFDGVITYIDWYNNKEVADAYHILRERQPELFKER